MQHQIYLYAFLICTSTGHSECFQINMYVDLKMTYIEEIYDRGLFQNDSKWLLISLGSRSNSWPVNIVSSAIITSTDFGFWSFKEVGNRYGNFSMATMFPRRVFTAEDMNKTLVELELAPSASIVILPVSRPVPLWDSSVPVELTWFRCLPSQQSSWQRSAVVPSSGSGIWTVLGTLLYPLLAVWRFLSSLVFASPSPREAASRGQSQSQSNAHTSPGPDKAKRWDVLLQGVRVGIQ